MTVAFKDVQCKVFMEAAKIYKKAIPTGHVEFFYLSLIRINLVHLGLSMELVD